MQKILWYDLETWGGNTNCARIAQFAAVYTDLDLKIIEKPILYYCPPSKDYIPNPYALLVHKILPNKLPTKETINELELLKKIQNLMKDPNTIIAGYNTCRFDNLVLRFSFYRNALEPYLLQFTPGKIWDIIDVVRSTYALRPNILNWRKITTENQQYTSFKLEHLAADNKLEQIQAHDALSDVNATIALAQTIKQKNHKLYDYFFDNRTSERVLKLLQFDTKPKFYSPQDTYEKPPMLVHISGMVVDENKRTEVITPIAYHPHYANEIICLALQQNIPELFTQTAEDLREKMFAKKEILQENNEQRPRIFTIKTKNIPAIVSVNILKNKEDWQNINHNQELCQNNYLYITKNFHLIAEICQQIYSTLPNFDDQEDKDIDLSLYDIGFYSAKDKRLLQNFHQQNWQVENENTLPFDQDKLKEICFRIRARNQPQTLNNQEKQRWFDFCQKNYQQGHASQYTLAQCQEDIANLKKELTKQDDIDLIEEYNKWLKTNR